MPLLLTGRTYKVVDSRKGTYMGQCLSDDGDFVRFQIVEGEAQFLGRENAIKGDVVTARRGLARFVLQKPRK
jgi:hypothetical protein